MRASLNKAIPFSAELQAGVFSCAAHSPSMQMGRDCITATCTSAQAYPCLCRRGLCHACTPPVPGLRLRRRARLRSATKLQLLSVVGSLVSRDMERMLAFVCVHLCLCGCAHVSERVNVRAD